MNHPSGLEPAAAASLRRLLLALLALGAAGVMAELLLLAHDEDAWQVVPLAVLAAGFVAVAWHAARPSRITVGGLRAVMAAFIVTGVAGVLLHSLANAEFQREVDPGVAGLTLFRKVIRAKAPPALAPGVFVQLGLLGLVATFRDPVLRNDAPNPSKQKEE